MKFKYGFPPQVGCDLSGANRLINNYGRLHVVATLLGLLLVGPCLYLAWSLLWPHSWALGVFDQPPGVFIGTLVGIVIVHEFMHLLALPGAGRGECSYMGFDPKTHLPYVAYLGELSRPKAVMVAFMPILVLTLLPFPLAWMVPAPYLPMLSSLSILNGTAASGDVCIIFLLLCKVPRNAMVHGEFYGFARAEAPAASCPATGVTS